MKEKKGHRRTNSLAAQLVEVRRDKQSSRVRGWTPRPRVPRAYLAYSEVDLPVLGVRKRPPIWF